MGYSLIKKKKKNCYFNECPKFVDIRCVRMVWNGSVGQHYLEKTVQHQTSTICYFLLPPATKVSFISKILLIHQYLRGEILNVYIIYSLKTLGYVNQLSTKFLIKYLYKKKKREESQSIEGEGHALRLVGGCKTYQLKKKKWQNLMKLWRKHKKKDKKYFYYCIPTCLRRLSFGY